MFDVAGDGAAPKGVQLATDPRGDVPPSRPLPRPPNPSPRSDSVAVADPTSNALLSEPAKGARSVCGGVDVGLPAPSKWLKGKRGGSMRDTSMRADTEGRGSPPVPEGDAIGLLRVDLKGGEGGEAKEAGTGH